MKLKSLLAFYAITVLLFSCTKDNDFGDVKSIQRLIKQMYYEDDKLTSVSHYYYNEDKMIMLIDSSINTNRQSVRKEEYTYSEDTIIDRSYSLVDTVFKLENSHYYVFKNNQIAEEYNISAIGKVEWRNLYFYSGECLVKYERYVNWITGNLDLYEYSDYIYSDSLVSEIKTYVYQENAEWLNSSTQEIYYQNNRYSKIIRRDTSATGGSFGIDLEFTYPQTNQVIIKQTMHTEDTNQLEKITTLMFDEHYCLIQSESGSQKTVYTYENGEDYFSTVRPENREHKYYYPQ